NIVNTFGEALAAVLKDGHYLFDNIVCIRTRCLEDTHGHTVVAHTVVLLPVVKGAKLNVCHVAKANEVTVAPCLYHYILIFLNLRKAAFVLYHILVHAFGILTEFTRRSFNVLLLQGILYVLRR